MRRYIKRFREFLIETKWKLFFWLYMKSVWLFVKLDTIRFQSIELKDVFSPEVLELNRRMAKSIYTKSGMCASKRVNTYGELKTPKDTDITAPPIHPDCVDVPFSSVTDKYKRSFEESCLVRDLTPEEIEATKAAIEAINGKI